MSHFNEFIALQLRYHGATFNENFIALGYTMVIALTLRYMLCLAGINTVVSMGRNIVPSIAAFYCFSLLRNIQFDI
jgi:hypothetical protein